MRQWRVSTQRKRDNRLANDATRKIEGDEVEQEKLIAEQASPSLLGVRGQKPNPGSDEAVAMGCTCPRMDNGYGRIGGGNGPFWITGGCPLHDAP